MSHAKETPRQKMISLMYLILTCLLALNVSKEVLEGFVTINESIETTNSNFTDNTKKIMEAVDEAIKQGHNEFVPYYAKSKQVSALTQNTFVYLDSLKKELIKYTEDKKVSIETDLPQFRDREYPFLVGHVDGKVRDTNIYIEAKYY